MRGEIFVAQAHRFLWRVGGRLGELRWLHEFPQARNRFVDRCRSVGTRARGEIHRVQRARYYSNVFIVEGCPGYL